MSFVGGNSNFNCINFQSRDLSMNAFCSNFLAFEVRAKKALLFFMQYTTRYDISITAVGIFKFPLSFTTLLAVGPKNVLQNFHPLCVFKLIKLSSNALDCENIVLLCGPHAFNGLKTVQLTWTLCIYVNNSSKEIC